MEFLNFWIAKMTNQTLNWSLHKLNIKRTLHNNLYLIHFKLNHRYQSIRHQIFNVIVTFKY